LGQIEHVHIVRFYVSEELIASTSRIKKSLTLNRIEAHKQKLKEVQHFPGDKALERDILQDNLIQ